ncbi:hypothetical protein HK101_009059 [Irineochytrium annulatum]|nr:hypothetical protein HK101_009059 [Irineochytrium annulatum]
MSPTKNVHALDDEDPAAVKRTKITGEHALMTSAPSALDPSQSIRASLFDPSTTDSLRTAYRTSSPYLHVLIPDLVDDSLLRRVRSECRDALHATHKETDIYRVFQTGDLANLDGLPADELEQLRALKTLRDALYSDRFRALVEKVTGVARLSPTKCDLSHNIYKEGCHLICHDDVIGSRSVSYILYLTDPDEPWRAEEGGALELYPVVSKGTPAVDPSVCIPPAWNQLALFAVQPGRSFHSVAEVVTRKAGRDRPSISGWFHVLQEGEETDEERAAREEKERTAGQDEAEEDERARASLEQLTAGDVVGWPFEPIAAEDADVDPSPDALTESERLELSAFVNPLYLRDGVIGQARDRFCDESSIQLVNFLKPDVTERIVKGCEAEDERCGFLRAGDAKVDMNPVANYAKGVVEGVWMPRGPAHICRYLELTGDGTASDVQTHTALLASVRDSLFRSSRAFGKLLRLLTTLRATSSRGRVRRFRPGMDYTLATGTPSPPTPTGADAIKEADGILDATLCFVADDTAARRKAWGSDDFGGFECVMAPDEGNEDPAQYRAADVGEGGALLSVSAASNTLTLVMRSGGQMKFVKYVGAGAPGSRWDVSWEYRYADEGDDEGDGDE